MSKENVNHPSHYTRGGIEAIDVIEACGWGEGFTLGNAIKYIMRAGQKYPDKEIEDLEKAIWYINRRIEEIKHNTSSFKTDVIPESFWEEADK